jgi:hypothetical protein
LVDALSASPFAGAPTQPPSRRVITSRADNVVRASSSQPAEPGEGTLRIPAGATGVEFSMLLRVAK